MKRIRTRAVLFAQAIVVLAVLACAPASPSGPAGAPASGDGRSPQSAAPKNLTIAIGRELDAWQFDLIRVTRGSGLSFVTRIAQSNLVVEGDNFVWEPVLATEQLSFERGTWRINTDGTMVTTWRIHPNIKWHDGRPFTSDDLMFTFGVMTDREVPNSSGAALRIMESAEAPDPYTFVINWAGPYVDADQAPWLFPMPRHLLDDSYKRDKPNFPNHPWMTTDFVGLGPYRFTRWEPGSHLEFERFADYFKGRPAFDTVIVRFILDENTMIASMLAGQVDFLPPNVNIDLDAALAVKQRWEGTGNRVTGDLSGRYVTVEVQHRLELARPANGLSNREVRQAFYRAIDRDQIADVITGGLAPPADSWFFPNHPLRSQV
ncbi:MAG: hypothetical protein HW404_1420, partial [Anaerolineales bacterium]|nr:hypothetical protein [Anaerolineales bacterium]